MFVNFECVFRRRLLSLSGDGLFDEGLCELFADFESLVLDVDELGSPFGDPVGSVEFDACLASKLCDLLGDVLWEFVCVATCLCCAIVCHDSTSLSGHKMGERVTVT